MNKKSELIITQNNFGSVTTLCLFYTLMGSAFYFTVEDPFVIFIVAFTNFIGILINLFSAKTIFIYEDRIIIRKKLTKKLREYKKNEVFFSNTYNGMYSLGNTYGFSLKTRVNENGLGLVKIKNKNEQNIFYEKIKKSGYTYKYTGG